MDDSINWVGFLAFSANVIESLVVGGSCALVVCLH